MRKEESLLLVRAHSEAAERRSERWPPYPRNLLSEISLPGTTTLHDNSNFTSPLAPLRTIRRLHCTEHRHHVLRGVASRWIPLQIWRDRSNDGDAPRYADWSPETFNVQTPNFHGHQCHRKYPMQQRASAAKSRCSVHNAWKSRASGCLLQQQAMGRTHLSSADLSLPSRHWSQGRLPVSGVAFASRQCHHRTKLCGILATLLRLPAEVAFLPEYASRVSFRQTLSASGRCGPTPTHKRLLTVGPTSSDFKLFVL